MATEVNVGWAEPEAGDACELSRHKKISGRWAYEACGTPAEYVRVIRKGDAALRINLCRVCLGSLTKDLVGMLSA